MQEDFSSCLNQQKMRILKYIPILFAAIAMCSCNETYDPFEGDNRAPEIRTRSPYQSQYSFFTEDSVKIGHTYELQVSIEDEGRVEVSTHCTNPDWTSAYDGETFSVTPSGGGETDIIVRATDVYLESISARIHIVCFDNIAPVAKASCDVIAILTPYERMINASESFDPDQKYGGGIEAYEFTIGGIQTAINDDGYIYHVFPESGKYRIKVRVRDNDGVWSKDYYFDAVI